MHKAVGLVFSVQLIALSIGCKMHQLATATVHGFQPTAVTVRFILRVVCVCVCVSVALMHCGQTFERIELICEVITADSYFALDGDGSDPLKGRSSEVGCYVFAVLNPRPLLMRVNHRNNWWAVV